jgi:aryl-alcohol dehydrogenase-like predicted oxidoreductase
MRRVAIPRTDLELSRLSFGTASLHHLTSGAGRQDLLSAAFDHGFTHFDTAPSYGFGIGEAELGRFLKGKAGKVSVATKVGLYAPEGSHPNTAEVWARKLAGKLKPSLSQPVVDWSISAAKKSLESSLRRLSVERVDLVLLHEPLAGSVDSDAFLKWLEEELRRGRVRAWGLAGEADRLRTWLENNHGLARVLQVRDSLDRREADLVTGFGRELQITYGYLSAASARPVSQTLEQALSRNAAGSILVSTRQVSRVRELAAICEKENGKDR